MKFLLGLCLVICFVGAHCDDIPAKIKEAMAADPHMAECMTENKVDAKTFEHAQGTNVVPSTPEVKCYLACMMKKEGMMNADGTFTQKFLDDSRTKDCRKQDGKDACEIAFKTVDCMVNAEIKKASQKTK